MRFTVARGSLPLIEELAIALDREDQPIAETWRRVSDAASQAGVPRPSYANVRRLVLADRRRRRELSEVLTETAADIAAGRVPELSYTLGRVRDARAKRPIDVRVSETQGFEGERSLNGA